MPPPPPVKRGLKFYYNFESQQSLRKLSAKEPQSSIQQTLRLKGLGRSDYFSDFFNPEGSLTIALQSYCNIHQNPILIIRLAWQPPPPLPVGADSSAGTKRAAGAFLGSVVVVLQLGGTINYSFLLCIQ